MKTLIGLKRQNRNGQVSAEDIDRLLERYYEGLTSTEEESLLRTWLSRPDIPSRFEADKALFGFFAEQRSRTVKKGNVLRIATWFSAAAAILAFLLVTGNVYNSDTNDYVLIQGKKYTNLTLAKKKALSTLSLLNEPQDEVSKSASLLNEGDNLIQEQLNLLDDAAL